MADQDDGGWARFEVGRGVSDADGDRSSVELALTRNGTGVDTASYDVSDASGSVSTRLEDKKGSGSHELTLAVTDAAGTTTSRQRTVTA